VADLDVEDVELTAQPPGPALTSRPGDGGAGGIASSSGTVPPSAVVASSAPASA
jgi:hypothetical protein